MKKQLKVYGTIVEMNQMTMILQVLNYLSLNEDLQLIMVLWVLSVNVEIAAPLKYLSNF